MGDLVVRLGRGFDTGLVRLRRLHLLLERGDVTEDVAELVFGKAGLAHLLAEARQGHNGFLAVVVFHALAPHAAGDGTSLHRIQAAQEVPEHVSNTPSSPPTNVGCADRGLALGSTSLQATSRCGPPKLVDGKAKPCHDEAEATLPRHMNSFSSCRLA